MPVFNSAVFNSAVFNTDSAGLSATMTGSGTLSGALAASLIFLAATMIGSGSMSASLLTAFLLAAIMAGSGTLAGDLKVARFMGRLRTCGEPLTTANQDWILA